MTSIIRANLGQTATIDATLIVAGMRLVMVSRLARVQLTAPTFSVWFQLRGTTNVEACEGRFCLNPGDWIALDQESMPILQASRNGLLLGMVAPQGLLSTPGRVLDHSLFPGRGHCHRPDRIITVRMWRETAGRLQSLAHEKAPSCTTHIDPLLTYLSLLQREIHQDFDRCPGRSSLHKAKIFGRLQRARLFLEGNGDRIVGLDELARQTSFSRWHLSKAFQATYRENLQAASRRIRIERACGLLAKTSLSICEVAAHCGFDNPCSFARTFRSVTGMTSTRYRDLHRRNTVSRLQRQTPTPARMPRTATLNLLLR